MKRLLPLMILTAASMTTTASELPAPPVAATVPHEVRAPHGAVRNDEYYWMRDDSRSDERVLAHLRAENAYTDAVMAPLQGLQERVYGEITARIKQDDSSVPYRERGWWYYTRFEPGKDYAIYARREGSMEAPEQVMLDGNALAEGRGFFQIGDWAVSQDNNLLAYAEDSNGRRQYQVRIKNLATGELYPDIITNVEPNLVWDDDNRTLYYIEKDPQTLLSVRVRAHVLGTPTSEDRLVYEEQDDSFYMGIGRTRSDKYLCIFLESTVSSEQRCMAFAEPGVFHVVAPRERDFEYGADHLGDRWVIRTNWNARNFRMMTVADGQFGDRSRWQELIPHREDVYLEDFDLFEGFLAIEERANALTRIRIIREGGADDYVAVDEPAYTMGTSINAEADTDWLRYSYTSLTTPNSTYEVNVRTGERRLLKRDPVLGGFDPANYVTERLWATARDGTRIPVSVVYRRGFQRDGTAALFQYGYGSYGITTDPRFNLSVISLLDRGMVYAIAHVRGGEELGRPWYEDGKLLNKMNSFTDFIDVTDFLVREGYAAPGRVAAMGGSAGGLLMGAIANMAPEKYQAIVALVPFVDVVTTMLDESIPLTTNEYDEWGNPSDPEFYRYMLSYSPYDNVGRHDYPAIFVGTGLHDSQVQYFEPAKWVARLRAMKTDGNALVFRINMEAGHGGRSGRFQRYREQSEQYAFILSQLGIDE
jgi:oligopeptidase B